MYCCYWSSLLVMIPACHQSWHSLQTSQGGWKLNRGSLPCLWPKETCVWCVYVCSSTGVLLYWEWKVHMDVWMCKDNFLYFSLHIRLQCDFLLISDHTINASCMYSCGLAVSCELILCVLNNKSHTCIPHFLPPSFLLPPLGFSDLQHFAADSKNTTKLSRNTGAENTNTHACQWACTHSRLLASQHNKPKPHFTPGLAGIYWVSSHPVGGEGRTTPCHC